ncbi:transmembrane protein 6/97 [Mycena olivaceomarginata]|nr:transmembrane protein 6/97 [Mycena olivaceomarginata]
MAPTPLTSRPLDLVYFGFFVSHIFASLCIDFQAIYPPALVPGFLRTFAQWYIHTSNDPFIGGIFLCLEVFFQFPTFFIAARGLLNDSKKIYVLMLVYGASTATYSASPRCPSDQRVMLLASYVPFFLLPLLMTVDMAFRLHGIVGEALSTREAVKRK